jgi:uncharacterized membrane protein
MAGEHHYIRTTLIGGMLVVLPLFVFANLLLWLGTWIAGKTAPVAELIATNLQLPIWVGHALTVAVILVSCFVLGAIVSTRFGNRAFNWLERNTVQRVPGYKPVKEIVSYLGKRDQNPFARPVIVTVGDDIRLTGFLSDEGAEGTTVFVPTGPNPTTGLVLHVLPSQVQRVPIPGSDVLQTVIACGAGSQRLLRSLVQPGVALAESVSPISADRR